MFRTIALFYFALFTYTSRSLQVGSLQNYYRGSLNRAKNEVAVGFANPVMPKLMWPSKPEFTPHSGRNPPRIGCACFPRRRFRACHFERQMMNGNYIQNTSSSLSEGLSKLTTWLSDSSDAKTMNLRLVELGDSTFENQSAISIPLVRVPGCTSVVEVAIEINEAEFNPSIKVIGRADARIARCVLTILGPNSYPRRPNL